MKVFLKAKFGDFDEFDLFKDIVLKNAAEADAKLKEKMEIVFKFEEAGEEMDDFYSEIEDEGLKCKTYEKEMPKLLVILFYSTVEIKLKKILSELTNLNKKDVFDFDFPKIQENFRSSLKIDFKRLSSFEVFNELRWINNCLKHNEVVNDKLQDINKSRWKKDNALELTKEDLDRLLPKSKQFFTNLLENLAEGDK